MTDFLHTNEDFDKTTMSSKRSNSLMNSNLNLNNMNIPMINNMFNPMNENMNQMMMNNNYNNNMNQMMMNNNNMNQMMMNNNNMNQMMMNNNYNNNMNQMMTFMNQMMNCYNNNNMNENQINMNNQEIIILKNSASLNNNIMIDNMLDNLDFQIKSMINNQGNNNDKKLIKKKIEELKIKQKLIRFLKFISFMNETSENEINFKGSKIFINYYNIVKFVVYLDLDQKIKELISYIFWKIFYSFKYDLKFKRFHKNETTEYIIQNPKKIPEYNYLIEYSNFLFLEFKNKPLSMFEDKTASEIGLKENDEVLLKLNNDFYDDLYKKFDIQIIVNYLDKKTSFFWCENISRRLNQIFVRKNCRLSFNSHFLEDTDILTGFTHLFIEECNRLYGTGDPPINFADVSTGKIKELKFSKNAPKWRIVNKGLNIFGICKNRKCEAFNKEVIYKTFLSEKGLTFNLNEQIPNIKCPICNKIIKPKTCGFYKCEYQFKGKKIEDGEIVYYDSKTKEAYEDKFEYYDPYENTEVQWLELIIFVLPKQEIKYEPN